MAVSTQADFFQKLGISGDNLGGFGGEWIGSGPELEVITPIDGSVIGTVRQVTRTSTIKSLTGLTKLSLGGDGCPPPSGAKWCVNSA